MIWPRPMSRTNTGTEVSEVVATSHVPALGELHSEVGQQARRSGPTKSIASNTKVGFERVGTSTLTNLPSSMVTSCALARSRPSVPTNASVLTGTAHRHPPHARPIPDTSAGKSAIEDSARASGERGMISNWCTAIAPWWCTVPRRSGVAAADDDDLLARCAVIGTAARPHRGRHLALAPGWPTASSIARWTPSARGRESAARQPVAPPAQYITSKSARSFGANVDPR